MWPTWDSCAKTFFVQVLLGQCLCFLFLLGALEGCMGHSLADAFLLKRSVSQSTKVHAQLSRISFEIMRTVFCCSAWARNDLVYLCLHYVALDSIVLFHNRFCQTSCPASDFLMFWLFWGSCHQWRFSAMLACQCPGTMIKYTIRIVTEKKEINWDWVKIQHFILTQPLCNPIPGSGAHTPTLLLVCDQWH